jgi:hypothetical protein
LKELALHLLDIAHNSVSAKARNISIEVIEDTLADRLRLSVADDGVGMDAELLQRVADPFVTSRTTRKVGLGIPLFKAAAESCNGFLTIDSQPGVGTRLDVEFQRSHIDRMPLGDVAETVLTLVIGCPEIHWRFIYKFEQDTFEFDDAFFKSELDGIPLTEPAVLGYLRGYLQQGVAEIQRTAESF